MNDQFYAKNTRVIIPDAPYREMNYNILGETEVDMTSWYNMNQIYGNYLTKDGTFNVNKNLYNQEEILD